MKITIKQKTSNTGSIYDLASEHGDIVLKIPTKGYAVLVPSYYNIDPKIVRTLNGAAKAYWELKGYEGRTILDEHGQKVHVQWMSSAKRWCIDGIVSD